MSVDAIIDQHENEKLELVGKVAIARAILTAEKQSHLRPPRDRRFQIELSMCASSCLPLLGRLAVEGRRISELDKLFHNLTIITFNYDRCIEHYLPFSLTSHYGISLDEARRLVTQLRVYHPFGTVGRLPWMPGTGPAVDFGDDQRADLVAVADQIRTFTEQMEDEDTRDEMRRAMRDAHRIVYLGFAYHRPNMELIAPPAASGATSIFGTVKGISRNDQAVVHRQIARSLQVEERFVTLLDNTCAELFSENWRSLTE